MNAAGDVKCARLAEGFSAHGGPTAERECAEETGQPFQTPLFDETTYCFSVVTMFHESSRHHTCHVAHIHIKPVATRDEFDRVAASFDARRTDEAVGVVAIPLYSVAKFGLAPMLGPGGGLDTPMGVKASRGKDIMLIAYLHGVLSLEQVLAVARQAKMLELDQFERTLSAFAAHRVAITARSAKLH